MLKNEWKKLFQNKFMIVVMIAIILIPTIYTAIFVGAMWDPYGRVEHLPVAVVNKDVPVTYKDKELSVGEDLVKNLKKTTLWILLCRCRYGSRQGLRTVPITWC